MRQREKVGILVVNLGTPDSTQTADVRRYLKEFLSDPRVLDMNPIARWLLLTFVILRSRPAESGHAYKTIWTDRGSPLLLHSQDLVEALKQKLPDREIVLAMRYGNPSIEAGLDALAKAQIDRLVVAPLYPHYASSSTGTVLDMVYKLSAERWNVPNIQVLTPFYDEPGFIEAWAAICKATFESFEPDHILFSYHGLPERHVQKSDPTGQHCLASKGCCDVIVHANRHCYRAQCYATTRALTPHLGLDDTNHTVAFQSRLGKDPWIQPYTDLVLTELASRGVKRLAVVCPAFVADCLETLEEIGIRAKEDFIAAGGDDLVLVPSLNAEPLWVDALTDMLRSL